MRDWGCFRSPPPGEGYFQKMENQLSFSYSKKYIKRIYANTSIAPLALENNANCKVHKNTSSNYEYMLVVRRNYFGFSNIYIGGRWRPRHLREGLRRRGGGVW